MKYLIIALTIFLASCGTGAFTVSRLDDTFSTDKSPAYVSKNNRISTKSVAGGIHIDAKGVFLNPFVIKNASTGQAEVVGFNIINKAVHDTTYGGANQLGYINKVTFRFSNGDLIVIPVKKQSNENADTIQYNSLLRLASYDKFETGIITLPIADFERVASSSLLSCKIEGSRQSVAYTAQDISKTFVANINQFYSQHVR